MRRGLGRRVVALAAMAFVVGACSPPSPATPGQVGATATPAQSAATTSKQLVIYYVSVAAPTGFFAYLNKGGMDAAANLGVKFVYVYPDSPTIPAQVEKITQAIAAKADGIIINGIGSDQTYYDVIKQGNAAAISFGSALGPQAKMGTQLRDPKDPFLFHVGSDEYAGGVLIGTKLLSLGVKGRVVVGNQAPADSATCQPRAAGVVDTVKTGGITSDVLELTLDPGQQTEAIQNYLRAHPDTGAFVSACTVLNPFLSAKQQSGRSDLLLAGWDLDDTVVAAIKSGASAFTIDQQPYWRGYMPVLLMTHYLRYGLLQANPFLTGPAIIDKTNIETVQNLASQGYR